MRRVVPGTAVVAVLLATLGVAGTAGAVKDASEIPPDATFVPHELLVRFSPEADDSARRSALAEIDGRTIRTIGATGYDLVRTKETVREAVATLAAIDAVADVEPNYTGTIAAPNDPCINGCGHLRQWNAGAVNAFRGWNAFPGTFHTATSKAALAASGDLVKVAVLDTKIDVNALDWRNRGGSSTDAAAGGQVSITDAKDFVPPSAQSGSALYHGTFVAGILAASADNSIGIAGIGYHVAIIPITVVDGNGGVTAANLASGIDYAVTKGARVVNMSLGLLQTSSTVQVAIDQARTAGVLSVAAAGNYNSTAPFYPGSHDNVMAVAATDEADRKGACSNHGSQISVAAPGVDVVSIDPRTSAGYNIVGCGTSTATPHVSALAGMLFAQNPARTPDQVRAIIERSADDDAASPGFDQFRGHGRINIERALMDGVGPTVDLLAATIPPTQGGNSTVTAVATSASPIREAQWIFSGGGSGSVSASDGGFGETNEGLVAQIPINLNHAAGVHRVYMRARDDSGWGPAAVVALVVDRRGPSISGFEASPVAAATAGQAVQMQIAATDDYSKALTFSYSVRSALTDELVFQSGAFPMPSANVTHAWLPEGLHGSYMIELTVRDEAYNPARGYALTIVV